ncbi:hypothetical protein SAMN04488691_105118 [Haloferax larsenii]|uniref:Uncharacterized protein n=2 Tax=Haloferax larsenii TaxID=302484 RepID=A0A1H7QQA1_HALLR|nr:hypothetical protein SAMN04488691_105118 [Haloferax larsenii]
MVIFALSMLLIDTATTKFVITTWNNFGTELKILFGMFTVFLIPSYLAWIKLSSLFWNPVYKYILAVDDLFEEFALYRGGREKINSLVVKGTGGRPLHSTTTDEKGNKVYVAEQVNLEENTVTGTWHAIPSKFTRLKLQDAIYETQTILNEQIDEWREIARSLGTTRQEVKDDEAKNEMARLDELAREEGDKPITEIQQEVVEGYDFEYEDEEVKGMKNVNTPEAESSGKETTNDNSENTVENTDR